MYNIPAIIFAGGKSSRMGRDKALLPFHNYTSLSNFQYQKLNNIFEIVYLSSKEDKFDFNCTIIKDIYRQSSPLIGIISVFETLSDNAVFILSVDAPFIDKNVIEKLYTAYKDNPTSSAIIAKSPKGIEPLCGIYTRNILSLAKEHLNTNKHKLTDLLFNSSIIIVYFDTNKPFININTPDEYNANC